MASSNSGDEEPSSSENNNSAGMRTATTNSAEGPEGEGGGPGLQQEEGQEPLTFSFSFSTNPTMNPEEAGTSTNAGNVDSNVGTTTSDAAIGRGAAAGGSGAAPNNINITGGTQPNNAATATATATAAAFSGASASFGPGGPRPNLRFSFSGNPPNNTNAGGGAANNNNHRPMTLQEQQLLLQEQLRRHNIQIHAPPGAGLRVNLNGRGIPIRGIGVRGRGGGPLLGRAPLPQGGGRGLHPRGRGGPHQRFHPNNNPMMRREMMGRGGGGRRGGGVRAPPGGPGAYVSAGVGRGRGGRIPISINVNTTTAANNSNNNNGVNGRFNKLPKLQPQMLPEDMQETRPKQSSSSTDDNNGTVNDNEEKEDENNQAFKCAICYDVMNDPAGCGKCSARFCFSCLQRVTELSAMQQQNNNSATCRCPVCRSPMDDGVNDIQRDGELKRRMDEAPPITCRYVGCNEQVRMSQIAQHELTCSFVKMSCRYKNFGCSWSGNRFDLIRHEQEECHLARVSQLVEQHRHLQVETAQLSHMVAHLHQNVLANASIMELQRARETHSLPIRGNVLDLCHYVYLMTCCTPRFLIVKDTWAPAFHGDVRGRATVANFVTMLPSNVLILKTLSKSYQQLLLSYRSIETEDQLLDLLDSILYFLFVTLLAVVLGLCFYGEGSNPNQWQPLPLQLSRLTTWLGRFRGNNSSSSNNNNNNTQQQQQQQESNLLLYSAIFAMAASHSFALEMSQNWLRAALVWMYLCLASTVFPGMVTRMMVTVINPPNTPLEELPLIHAGRATRPIWLGLQYGVCAVCAVSGVEGGGILPAIDCAVSLFLSQDILKIPATMRPHSSEVGLLANIPTSALYVYIGARLAMRANDFPQVGWLQSLDFLLMAMFVLLTQVILVRLYRSGSHLGCHILHQSRQRINPAALPMLRTEYHGIGVSMFVVWGLLVGAIATT